MRASIGKPLLLCLMLGALPALAQERKAIDVFENQDELPERSIRIDGAGDPSGANDPAWDGTSSGRTDGGLSLRYERDGTSILVPAQVNGQTAYFLFDTGATYTTLTGEFARSAGVFPKKSYPTGVSQTANGPRKMRFGLMNALTLGGRRHGGVTFALCDRCPQGTYKGKPIVGLLGMNVIGRYRTSFDDAKGVIEMVPTSAYMDRDRDIRPWVEVNIDNGVAKGTSLFFIGTVTNRSPRRIETMTVQFVCAGGEPVRVSRTINGGQKAKFRAAVTSGDCREDFDAKVVESRW